MLKQSTWQLFLALLKLVEQGADVNYTDPYNGRTPLINAAFGQGFSYNLVEKPLFSSSLAFLKENLELLLEKGASIDAQDCNGATALMSCCSRRDTGNVDGCPHIFAKEAKSSYGVF